MSQYPTLNQIFLQRVQESGGKVAVSDERGELTFQQLGGFALAVAALLDEDAGGVKASENVAILVPTVKEFPAAYFGVLLSGRTPVPVNYLLEEAELAIVLQDAQVNTVIASRFFAKAVDGKLPRVHYLEDFTPAGVMKAATTYRPTAQPAPGDVATLLYTSGTTGRPKGVELTHENLSSNIVGTREAIHVTADDSLLGVLPMFHSFALTVTMNLPIAVGASAHYMTRFVAAKALDVLREKQLTILPLVPSMYRALIRSASRVEDLQHNLRIAAAGGEPLPGDVAQAFHGVFGVEILEGYGLTETSPVLSFNRPEAFRHETVGQPLDNLELGIFDDDGKRLGTDVDGEIWARGPSIMRGYRNRPEETAAVLDGEGWFKTGDIGRIDGEGFVKITGRKKEMIISGGENIYPREIEDALSSHAQVFEAAVIGVPDKLRGEMPYGFVALHEGATVTVDELREHARQHIADYKVPRKIEVLAELPHSPTGKILKRQLSPAE